MQCQNDGSIGPTVKGCRDDFDFTLTFENTFMSILPAGIFIVLCTGRLLALRRRRVIVQGRVLRAVKLVREAPRKHLNIYQR